MDFSQIDWRSIAGAVAPLAPKIGGVLGAAFPPFGAAIGSIAGSFIANKFGVPPTPEAVGKAITEDPQAAEKLTELERDHGEEVVALAQVEIERLKQQTEQFRIETVDRQDARSFLTDLNVNGGVLRFAAPALGVAVVTAFFAVLMFRMMRGGSMPPDQLLDGLTGTLGAAFMMVVSFFFGSTARSQGKDDTIRMQAATSAVVAPASAAAINGAVKAANGKIKR